MKKIITHINFAKGYRGGERQTQLLIEELSKNGYGQKLLARKNSELAKRCSSIKNLQIQEIAKPYIFSIAHIKDSVLLHAHETKGAQFAFFAHLFFKTPYIITRRVDNPIKNNFFNRKIYEAAHTTVVLSRAILQELEKITHNAHTQIIPSAYSALSIDVKNKQLLQKRFSGKFVVGNIGELDNTHKGQFYLIEAAKKLEKKYPDIHFIFLGKGRDAQNYALQSKGMQNITFEGFVDNVGDYISCMDLFVFPSLNEGLGSILFDVMQLQVPIIASNVGGIPDIISDKNGILIPPKNTTAIVNAIEKLYLDKEYAAELANNASKNIDDFSKESMCQKYRELYKSAQSQLL